MILPEKHCCNCFRPYLTLLYIKKTFSLPHMELQFFGRIVSIRKTLPSLTQFISHPALAG